MEEKIPGSVATLAQPVEEKYQQHGVDEQQRSLYRQFESNDPEWHRQQRKVLLRKIDWHMLPFLGAIYFMNYLDKK